MAKLDGYFDNVYHRNGKLFIKIGKCNEDLLRKKLKSIYKKNKEERYSEIQIISLIDGKESIRDYLNFKTLYGFDTDEECIEELRTIKHKVYIEIKLS